MILQDNELAYFFDASFIRVFSYYAPEGKCIDDYREEVLTRMVKKAALLKGSNIVMVHENESHIFGHNAENCVDIVRTVDSPNLKLAYDPANFVWGDHITNNVEVSWPLMKPYVVVHVHIKDWKLGSTDVGSIPGEGDGQIKELLTELVNMQYDGRWVHWLTGTFHQKRTPYGSAFAKNKDTGKVKLFYSPGDNCRRGGNQSM